MTCFACSHTDRFAIFYGSKNSYALFFPLGAISSSLLVSTANFTNVASPVAIPRVRVVVCDRSVFSTFTAWLLYHTAHPFALR